MFFAVGLVALLATACDWTIIHSTLGNTGQAVDQGFTPAQATNLAQQWRFRPGGSIFATSVTFMGIVYVPAGNGTLYALDSRQIVNGAPTVIWSKRYGQAANTTCPTAPTGLVSSVTVRGDERGVPLLYVYTPQGTLQKLDGRDGSPIWESPVFEVPDDNQNDYFSWATPTIANGRVYVGTSSNCDTPFVRSQLKSFDVDTGALLATFETMPDAPDPDFADHDPVPPDTRYVGAGIWTTSASGDGNSIFVNTGSTYDDTNAEHPPLDDNDFDQYSLLKLDAVTLEKQGKFAIPQPDGGDPDWGSGTILFSARLNGTPTQIAGGCNKDGIFYAVRTDTMKPIWGVRVGTSSPAGEVGCLSGAVWDSESSRLFVTGNDTRVGGAWTRSTGTNTSGDTYPLWIPSGGTAAPSATRRLDPATGMDLSGSTPKPSWETAQPQRVLGACSMNGASTLIACQTTNWSDTDNALVLLNVDTGAQVAALRDSGQFPGFSTPIWSDGRLIVTDTDAVRSYKPRA